MTVFSIPGKTIRKKFATAIFAVGAIGLTGCKGGIEGTYKLDKGEMKESLRADFAKLPVAQQALREMALTSLDTMDITMELQAGGKLNMNVTMPDHEHGKLGKTENKQGTWKLEGDAVVLDSGDGKPTRCSKAAKKLSCASDWPGNPPMVFIKL